MGWKTKVKDLQSMMSDISIQLTCSNGRTVFHGVTGCCAMYDYHCDLHFQTGSQRMHQNLLTAQLESAQSRKVNLQT